MSKKKFNYDFQAIEYLNKELITKHGYHVVDCCNNCKHYMETVNMVSYDDEMIETSYYCKRGKQKGPSGLTLAADIEPAGICDHHKKR